MDVQKILDAKKQSGIMYSIPNTTTLSEFVRQACEKNVGALLITDNKGKLSGILSERDILHQCNAGVDFKTTTVAEIMTKSLIVVKPTDDINTVMDLMIAKKIRHLPVVSENKILGIITIRDLIHAMRKADKEEINRLVEYLQSNLITD
ncbi:MAG: CBS domain-containing protein [Kiritimatiellae bacterium]|nr:CBS domain-containing protein [Kiritimatiellia bacterium]MDD5520453.1 CBS domain-containing protein [Kiritimatiellia bacterium]